MMHPAKENETTKTRQQPEHQGSLWTHPYMLYLWITALLFAALLFVGWLGWKNGWIAGSGG